MGSVDSLTDLANALEIFFKGLSECGLLAMYSVQLQVTTVDFVVQIKFQCLLQQLLQSIKNILLKINVPGHEFNRSVSIQTSSDCSESIVDVKEDDESSTVDGGQFRPVNETCVFTQTEEPVCWTDAEPVKDEEGGTFVVQNSSDTPSTDIIVTCHSTELSTTSEHVIASDQTNSKANDEKHKLSAYSEETVQACNVGPDLNSLSLKKSSNILCETNKNLNSTSCDKHYATVNELETVTVTEVSETEEPIQQNVEPLIMHTYGEEQNSDETRTIVHIVVASTDSKDSREHNHKIQSEDRKQFECKECDKSFSTTHSLEIHFSRKHGSKGQCDMCTMRFSSIQSLQEHCRLEHGGTGCFNCPICNRRFMTKLSFKRHVDIHAGKKGAVCDMCGKTFSRADYLSKHYMTHSGARPLSCSRCPRKFISSSHLKNHEKTHTGIREHVCELCQKSFSRGDKLKEHMLRHLNIKRFQCAVCKRHYAEKRDLRKHMRMHEK